MDTPARPPGAGPNPIMDRVARLDAQWAAFADDDAARCLHWLIEPDEWRMLDLFFTTEETSDAFLQADVAFTDERSHGLRLRAWLDTEYRRVEPDLLAAGAEGGWTLPTSRGVTDDVVALVEAARSLWEHHQPLFSHLVLVLVPTAIGSPAAWMAWLERLLVRMPPELRIVVVDYREAPALGELAIRRADVVRTVPAALDMPGAYAELSLQAGGLDAPPGAFRHAFVQMCNAIAGGDMKGAEASATRAREIADAQRWSHLAFAVEFARGSGHLGEGDPQRAIACYRAAEREAEHAETAGEPFGPRLRLQARLGQGAACLKAEAFAPAASVYEAAVPLAKSLGDPLAELDCLRMASYCHERAGAPRPAWSRGIEALAVGEAMDPETRRHSTLAYAGETLLRVCDRPGFGGHEAVVHTKMRSLLGDGWRPT